VEKKLKNALKWMKKALKALVTFSVKNIEKLFGDFSFQCKNIEKFFWSLFRIKTLKKVWGTILVPKY
jgi:hypothetical protein